MEIKVKIQRSKPRLGHRVLAQSHLDNGMGRMMCYAYNGDIHIGYMDPSGELFTVSMSDVVTEVVLEQGQNSLVDSIVDSGEEAEA